MGWGIEHFGGDAEPHSNTVALLHEGSERNVHSNVSAIHKAVQFDSTYVTGSFPLHCRIAPASNTCENIAESTARVAYEPELNFSKVRFLDALRSAPVSRLRQEPSRVFWEKARYFRSAPNLLLELNTDALLSRNWRLFEALAPVPAEPTALTQDIPAMVQAELDAFAEGIEDLRPSSEIVIMALRIARTVVANVEHPDITMDIDGELSFDLRRRDGRLVLAEMEVDGTIHASLYDCQNLLLEHMPSATEAEFTLLFQS